MRLNLKMSSACLALLDDRSDHYLETLAVTLQVSLTSRVSRQFLTDITVRMPVDNLSSSSRHRY